MGLFSRKTKAKDSIYIGAPIKGSCISLQEVKDPTFSEEMLGKGIAIIPIENTVVAPCDAMITTVFPTGHAVGLKTDEGIELLIHVGLDTVQLKGEHFVLKVVDGQKVKKGDTLIEVDIAAVKAAGYDITTPVVVCNTEEFKEVTALEIGKEVQVLDQILSLIK